MLEPGKLYQIIAGDLPNVHGAICVKSGKELISISPVITWYAGEFARTLTFILCLKDFSVTISQE